jgi:frataxin-like iron-binding protein CyaY
MSRRFSEPVDYPQELLDDFDRLDDDECMAIDVTGHTLAVRREEGKLIGVRYSPDKIHVASHQKDREFVLRMMNWTDYEFIPRDEPPFGAPADTERPTDLNETIA